MGEKTKLQYVYTGGLLDDRLWETLRKSADIASMRSERWREFLKLGPMLRAAWINEMFDWLVEEYPDEFELQGGKEGQ